MLRQRGMILKRCGVGAESALRNAAGKARRSDLADDTRCMFVISGDTRAPGPVLDLRNCLDPVSATFHYGRTFV